MKGRVAERENFLLRAWMFSHLVCTGNVCFIVSLKYCKATVCSGLRLDGGGGGEGDSPECMCMLSNGHLD